MPIAAKYFLAASNSFFSFGMLLKHIFRGCQRNKKCHLFCIIFRLTVLGKIQDSG
jgi:hypothetical protein